VIQINAAPNDDVGPWLEAAKGQKGHSLRLEQRYLPRRTFAPSPAATTDAGGRIRLAGIGRSRLVLAQLDGPTIASQYLHILTRPGEAIEVPEHNIHPGYGYPRTVVTYYGANFRHAAAPTKPVVGVARDRDTKEPLAGITIRSLKRANSPFSERFGIVEATTDAQGRYRLTGMPPGAGNKIQVVPPRDLPYIAVEADVPDGPGLDPVTVDVELKRGVWIMGRITDKVTGRPVPASVVYVPLDSNTNLRDHPGFAGTVVSTVAEKADGSYRIAVLPGPGWVAVDCPKDRDHYLRASERDDEDGLPGPVVKTSPFARYHRIDYRALAWIDPAKGVDVVKRDVTLDPGWTFTGTVLGPDGRPLATARSFGLAPSGWGWSASEGMPTAEFTARAFNPHRPRDILFNLREKGLVGVAQAPQEDGGSVRVRMGPGAAVTGRLVGADGLPRAGVVLAVTFRPKGGEPASWDEYPPGRIQTDREGRFRIEALLPGYEFRLNGDAGALSIGGGLSPGRTKDLGDVRMKAEEDG
jgi:protocatechuate 3,4-dioxygenase beta subunit